MELTKSLDSGLRRLLPKPRAHQHAFHSPASPSRSLRNPQFFDGVGAVGFAAGSAGPFCLAQRKADHVRQASAAGEIMRPPSQEHQSGSVEAYSLGCQSALPLPTDAIFQNAAYSRNLATPSRIESPNKSNDCGSQTHSSGDISVSPNPKILISRIKSEKRLARLPKVAVACDSCR